MDGIPLLTRAAGAMQVFAESQGVVAHNIANVSTEGFAPRTARLASAEPQAGVVLNDIGFDAGASGVEIPREFVRMITHQHAYDANAAVVRTADEMLGTALDMLA